MASLKPGELPLLLVGIGRFGPVAVMSLKICLDFPILNFFSCDERGVKKRVKVRGVTVGFLLGLPELWHFGSGSGSGSAGDEGGEGGSCSRTTFSFESSRICKAIGDKCDILAIAWYLFSRRLGYWSGC